MFFSYKKRSSILLATKCRRNKNMVRSAQELRKRGYQNRYKWKSVDHRFQIRKFPVWRTVPAPRLRTDHLDCDRE